MKFKHSKMTPMLIREAVPNYNDYAMYVKDHSYPYKEKYNISTMLMYRIWHLFDGSCEAHGLPGLYDNRLSPSFAFDYNYRRYYNYGFPSFPDLMMYIHVLMAKQSIIPNATEELKLLNKGILVHDPNDLYFRYTVGIVDALSYIDSVTDSGNEVFHDHLSDLKFVTSATGNQEGLDKLRQQVENYTIITSIDSFARYKIGCFSKIDIVGNKIRTPRSLVGSENIKALVDRSDYFEDDSEDNNVIFPKIEKKHVLFKDRGRCTLETTVEDIKRTYKDVLDRNFDGPHFLIHDKLEMSAIHERIKSKLPSSLTVKYFPEVYSSISSSDKKFKVKIRVPKKTFNDDPERVRNLFDRLYDIDPMFLVSDSYQGLFKNMVDDSRSLRWLCEESQKLLQNKIFDEYDRHTVACADRIDSWRDQIDILDKLAPTKISDEYKKFDDEVFDLISMVYMRKNLTISFRTDDLKQLNRLKLMGMEIKSIEYSYNHWRDVMAYLEEK